MTALRQEALRAAQTVDLNGRRPIAQLDQAALDAIRQWRFTPAAVAVPPAVPQTGPESGPLRVFGGVMEPRRTNYVPPV